MKIIIGLGNPGKTYENTRHNAGFIALDILRQSAFPESPWQEKSKLLATLAEGVFEKEKIILAKPTLFMNDSGRAVQKILDFYKASPSDLIIIHDDLDIAPGALKVTLSSRAAGHNGVTDIIEHLGTQDFKRYRVGIGRPAEVLGACQPSHDYVLGKFTSDESTLLQKVLTEHFTHIENLLS